MALTESLIESQTAPVDNDANLQQLVEEYDQSWKANQVGTEEPPQLVYALQELLQPQARILDLGSGPGRLSLPLAEAGFRVTAVDASPVAISQLDTAANKRQLDIQARVGDARRQPEADCYYDGLAAMFILHHLDHQDALDLLTRARQQTQPSGINAIATFSQQGDFYRENPHGGHYFPATMQEFLEPYTDDGWEILNYAQETVPTPDGQRQNEVLRFLARKNQP